MITKEIIKNFFEGKCNARDVAMVQAWLIENPGKLKEYIGEEEWEDFQPAHVLSPDISGKLWRSINKNTSSPTVQHHSHFRWLAVAASVLLVAGLSWTYVLKKQNTSAISAVTVIKPQHISNTTSQKMTLSLSDGSTVELLPNSTLSYAPEKFSSSKRDVRLTGEADFNIAKDVAKPFSVSINSVLITVFGTRFTVRSYEGNNAIKVILHEGRIRITIPDSFSRDNKDDYYLAPGDIFIFKNKPTPVRRAEPVVSPTPSLTPQIVSTDSLSSRILPLEKDKDDGYVFKNYPLDVVFDQLQIIYDTKIIYNKADLGNRSFIGRVDKKDSLYDILKSIARLNQFHLYKQGDSYTVSN